MTIKITKLRLGAAIVALALFVPATAWATHVFLDVVDSKFYAEPVEWAKNNDITTGVDPTHFDPDGAVTRGQSVTFLKRYNDNVAVPEIGNSLFGSDTNLAFTSTLGDLGLSVSVTIPENHTGVIELGFSAETACTGGGAGSWCKVDLLVGGVAVDNADAAFDSSDDATESNNSWEGHAMTRVTADLAAGTYIVTAVTSQGFGTPTFRIDDMVLTAEVHLTS